MNRNTDRFITPEFFTNNLHLEEGKQEKGRREEGKEGGKEETNEGSREGGREWSKEGRRERRCLWITRRWYKIRDKILDPSFVPCFIWFEGWKYLEHKIVFHCLIIIDSFRFYTGRYIHSTSFDFIPFPYLSILFLPDEKMYVFPLTE